MDHGVIDAPPNAKKKPQQAPESRTSTMRATEHAEDVKNAAYTESKTQNPIESNRIQSNPIAAKGEAVCPETKPRRCRVARNVLPVHEHARHSPGEGIGAKRPAF
jgi:hypothetical protein